MTQIEAEQEELLGLLCEAARSHAKPRRSFVAIRDIHGGVIRHQGLPGGVLKDFHYPDQQILDRSGLIHVSDRGTHGDDLLLFDLSPKGFSYWQAWKEAQGSGPARVEQTIRTYLAADHFRQRFPGAFERWLHAEARLWGDDSNQDLTTIGHECREAVQAFAVGFATLAGATANPSPSKDVDNVRRGLSALAEKVPSALVPMLDALLTYWRTVSDLVQRLEHGAQKEGEPIRWDDARTVLFQTGNLIFELTHALDRAQ